MKSNRRSFISTAVGTAAASSLAFGSRSEAIEPIHREGPSGMKLSLAGYSFRKEFKAEPPIMTISEEFMQFAAENGLGAIEPTSYYFPEDADRNYFLEYRRKAFLMGLTVSGTAIGNVFTHPKGPDRDKELALTRKWIDHASEMGAPCIRIFAGKIQKGSNEEEARGFAIECINESLEYAAEKGVFLALENHGGIVSNADQLLAIVREIDSEWFGVNLDTGNFHSADPYQELQQAAPYAITVQVKVEVKPEGQEKQPADLERIVKILRGVGYRGFVALEYEAAEDARTAIPGYLKQLKALIG
ncbi:MAG: sugar phosphate isomerase/epimerase [Candidatus Omnitrophica bacterium]|nr:sugar phosphate isomerase/epimerase [Candidatus Omnitrophota bacterium]MCA9424171.1 sugar phosphate isomerase/epimerase [Candidatus Omnitrophota bacterium]MCA9436863.1 sugar phosphate isomerase/epimerase [Candidatus Omnitrophota bacterium]MCA9445513.1 sugar phosphate isomerase/epimerase [Candidatus Omnitrophota bacterium]MCB9767371.1 sugar phosphate isomerase/epimerase [Candidatus Omnitrophota bacterium]